MEYGVGQSISAKEAWKELGPVCDLLLNPGDHSELKTISFSKLYSLVYRVCSQPCVIPSEEPRLLYKLLVELLTSHCRAIPQVLLLNVSSSSTVKQSLLLERNPNADLISNYVRFWIGFIQGVRTIGQVFNYLDKSWIHTKDSRESREAKYHSSRTEFVSDSEAVFDVTTCALVIWKHEVLEHEQFRSTLLQDLITQTTKTHELIESAESIRITVHSLSILARLEGLLNASSKAELSSIAMANANQNMVVSVLHVQKSTGLSCTLSNPARMHDEFGFHHVESTEFSRTNFLSLFETPLVDQCTNLYTELGANLVQSEGISKYVSMLETKVIDSELARYTLVISSASTLNRIRLVLIDTLITNHLNALNEHASLIFSNYGRFDDKTEAVSVTAAQLAPLYSILRHTGEHGLKSLQEMFKQFMIDQGLRVVADWKSTFKYPTTRREQAVTFVDSMWTLYNAFLKLVEYGFGSVDGFVLNLDQACVRVLNNTENRSALQLARFCHALLDETSGMFDLERIESYFPRVCRLFRYLDDKHTFLHVYARKLAVRLLHGVSVGLEQEEALLSEFKTICGAEYTSRLQRMLTDMNLSKLEIEEWRAHNQMQNTLAPKNFSVLVLTAGAWSLGQHLLVDLDCVDFSKVVERKNQLNDVDDETISNMSLVAGSSSLDTSGDSLGVASSLLGVHSAEAIATAGLGCLPIALCNSSDSFQSVYVNRHSGRKLLWMKHLARIEIRAKISEKLHVTVHATTLQTAVLMCFNDQTSLTAERIHTITALPLLHVKAVLNLLLESFLVTCDDPADSNGAKIFTVNEEYASCGGNKVLRLAMMKADPVVDSERVESAQESVSKRLAPGDDEVVHSSLDEDRRAQVQATLVRIMKQHRTMSHRNLVSELLVQLKAWLRPSDKEIKRSIDALIEKEYIARHETDSTLYIYMT